MKKFMINSSHNGLPIYPLQAHIISLDYRYSNQFTIKFEGEIDIEAMQKSWEYLTAQYDAFNAFIVRDKEGQGQISQTIQYKTPNVWHFEDWSTQAIKPVVLEKKLKSKITDIRAINFNLFIAPLMQFTIIKIRDHNYIAVLTFHPALLDEQSCYIILKQMVDNYFLIHQGKELLPIKNESYDKYFRWLQNQDKKSQISYWQKYLGGIETNTILSIENKLPKSANSSFYDEIRLNLTASLIEKIRAFSREHEIPISSIMQGAWVLILSRYCNSSDVVYGSIVPGRPKELEGIEREVGLFSNIVPIRIKIQNSETGAVFLKRFHLQYQKAQEHGYLPLYEIQGLNEADKGFHLFDYVFSYKEYVFDMSARIENSQKLAVSIIEDYTKMEYDYNKFKITCCGQGNEITIKLQYLASAFHRIDLESLLKNYEIIINAILENSEVPLSQLISTTSPETQQTIYRWSVARKKNLPCETIPELFNQQAKRSPNEIALVFGNRTLTYKELDEQSNQLAWYLQDKGVKVGSIVGIHMQPSTEAIISILAALKSGGVYLPLDPDYPKDRLQAMMLESNPLFVLTDKVITEKTWLFPHKNIILSYSAVIAASKTLPIAYPTVEISSKDAAYVIYTPGTTGKPKGIIGTHLGVINRINALRNAYPYVSNEVCCLKTSLRFIDHMAEMFSPLLCGIKLVILSHQSCKGDIGTLLKELKGHSVTRLAVVPSLLRAILDYSKTAMTDLSLRYIYCSGEALPGSVIKKIYEEWPKVIIINLYGLTEVSGDVSYHKATPTDFDVIIPYFSKSLRSNRDIVTQGNESITAINTSIDYLKENLNEFNIPKSPLTWDQYYQYLKDFIFPYAINTASPYYMGHMKSVIPSYNADLSQLITMLNQNVVQIETSKSLTLVEKQAVAMLHKRIYQNNSDFYDRYAYDPDGELGCIVSGGTMANILALWVARNRCFPVTETFAGVAKEGMVSAIASSHYKGTVIIISPLLHYSIKKAASILGLGEKNILCVALKRDGQLDLDDLQDKITQCQKQKLCIIALVAIAGATETGSIDPIDEMATIADKEGIYFHVDAAFGGPISFSKQHRYLLNGIDKADSVTICGHKQLYLPMGISVCLFKHREQSKNIHITADYQAAIGSLDMGKSNPEGSRPAFSLFLHASLHLLAENGYAKLINIGIENAAYLKSILVEKEEFELVWEPTINIVNYRYIPAQYRKALAKNALTLEDNDNINKANMALQKEQFLRGKTFVSKTWLPYLKDINGPEIVSLRVVLTNPLTTAKEIEVVVNDQIQIASEIFEGKKPLQSVSISNPIVQQSDYLLEKDFVSIGNPTTNTQMYILDFEMNLTPVGVLGELYIGGSNLAWGYINRPDTTAQSYIANPFATEDDVKEGNTRLYKTGDLCRWSHQGYVEYIGRVDSQVKLRGIRIECQEIEAALNRHSAIREAAIILKNDETNQKYLVAFCVQRDPLMSVSKYELREYLSKTLPDYMVPKMYVLLDKLPQTLNGKIDRQALRSIKTGDK